MKQNFVRRSKIWKNAVEFDSAPTVTLLIDKDRVL